MAKNGASRNTLRTSHTELVVLTFVTFLTLPATALSAQTKAPVPLPPRPTVAALKIEEPIQMDGALNDAAWQQAEVAKGFGQREPRPGQPASENTEVRIAYTNATLYIAIHAFAAEPEKVVAEEMLRDGRLFRDDSVIVLLDTFHDHRNAYWFETNANGARTDALVTDEGRDFNLQWNGVWTAVGRRTADGWTAELAIPFTTLRFDPENDTWGLNIRRLIRHKSEEVFWASVPLEANLFRVSMAGTLTGIHGPEPGLNLRVKPFGVGKSTDLGGFVGPASVAGGSQEDLEGGLDLKWGLTRTLTLDLTYNTDFAEVEVDDQQINLTRFSLFFPEKREFFLENAGIFEFGFNPPGTPFLKPFFSRRIGIGPFGDVVPVDWGARLTGRVGDWSVGLLDTQTDEVHLFSPTPFPFPASFTIPENNWGVARLKRNVGGRSTVGMIFTNWNSQGSLSGSDGDHRNRVFGLDADFNLSRFLNVAGFWTKSDDALASGSDDWAGGGRIAWVGPVWSWRMDAVQIGPDYNPEVGFLLRSGIRRYVPRVDYTPRPKLRGVRNFIFDASADIVTDMDDRLETLDVAADLFGVRLATEDTFVLFGEYTKDRVPQPFAIGPGVVVFPGDYEFASGGVNFQTNNSRRLAANGFALAGDFYGGDRLSTNINLGWRASRHLRTDTTWLHDAINLPGGRFDSNIIRQRVGISFNPDLSTNIYLQYADAVDLLSLNLRFDWIYRPGADIFLVFNQNWNAPGLGNLSSQERQVILKFTYLFEL
jgi:uncharacterized protein DUF5916